MRPFGLVEQGEQQVLAVGFGVARRRTAALWASCRASCDFWVSWFMSMAVSAPDLGAGASSRRRCGRAGRAPARWLRSSGDSPVRSRWMRARVAGAWARTSSRPVASLGVHQAEGDEPADQVGVEPAALRWAGTPVSRTGTADRDGRASTVGAHRAPPRVEIGHRGEFLEQFALRGCSGVVGTITRISAYRSPGVRLGFGMPSPRSRSRRPLEEPGAAPSP